MDRLLLARLNDPPDCPSIVGQGKATQPRAQASPDEQQRSCCFSLSARAPYPRTSLSIKSSLHPLSASHADTTHEGRLARLLDSAFALRNTPNQLVTWVPYYFAYVMIISQPSSHASPGRCGGIENSQVLKISITKNEASSTSCCFFRDHGQHFIN